MGNGRGVGGQSQLPSSRMPATGPVFDVTKMSLQDAYSRINQAHGQLDTLETAMSVELDMEDGEDFIRLLRNIIEMLDQAGQIVGRYDGGTKPLIEILNKAARSAASG